MFSSSPPTLWCVLMVALGPLKLIDSMTSGYSVPCNSHSILPLASPPFSASSFSAAASILAASASNTSMKVFPMIFRFRSGSSTPASRLRNRSEASMTVRFTPSWVVSISCTFLPSSFRSTPLSTMIAWNLASEGAPWRLDHDSPVTDSLVHELGSDGRVDTARDGSDDLALLSADLPDSSNLLRDERFLK